MTWGTVWANAVCAGLGFALFQTFEFMYKRGSITCICMCAGKFAWVCASGGVCAQVCASKLTYVCFWRSVYTVCACTGRYKCLFDWLFFHPLPLLCLVSPWWRGSHSRLDWLSHRDPPCPTLSHWREPQHHTEPLCGSQESSSGLHALQRAFYPLSPAAPFANTEQSKLTPEEPR